MNVTSFRGPAVIAGLLACFLWRPVSSAPMDTCFVTLNAVDDGDNLLTQVEYVAAIKALTNNAVSGDFFQFPELLGGAFSSRAAASGGSVSVLGSDGAETSATTAQITALETFCSDMYDGVVDALGLTVTDRDCTRALYIGDLSRDNTLSQSEYPRFVSILSGGTVAATTPYGSLPEELQQTFNDFAENDGVDVSGATPGSTPTERQVQFCEHATVALKASEQGAAGPAPAPTSSGTTTPTGGTSILTTSLTFEECTNDMFFSDRDRNSVIDSSEYVIWLNRLADDAYAGKTFDTLPDVLHTNYETLAAGGRGVDIVGSRPGQVATAEEEAHLQNVCDSTAAAISSARGGPVSSNPPASAAPGTPGPAPTSKPTPVPSKAIPFATCVRYMSLSDLNQDNALDQTEYHRFINIAGNRAWLSTDFAELPQVLIDNYNNLAIPETRMIDISGSKYNSATTEEQTANLEKICEETGVAIDAALNGPPATMPPISAPAVPQNATIYNAYIISNAGSLTAAMLGEANRAALAAGYDSYIKQQFADFLASQSRRLRARQLQGAPKVTLLENQIDTYFIEDVNCPEGERGTCQKVYSKFAIQTMNVADPIVVVGALALRTQEFLDAEEGGLQQYVDAAEPANQLFIVAPAEPRTVPAGTPTPAAGETPSQPTGKEEGGGGGGSSAGAIAGAVIGVLLVILLGGGGAWYYKRRGGTCPNICDCLPTLKMPKIGAKGEVKESGDMPGIDDDDMDGFSGFHADNDGLSPPSGESDLFQKRDVSTNDLDEGDSAGFSVQEQDASQSQSHHDDPQDVRASGKVFNAFGLGKHKKTSNGFGDDSIGELHLDDDYNENPANDFADYGFDDPVADLENNHNSMGELFQGDAAAMSPGKGSGWGADGGDTNWGGGWGDQGGATGSFENPAGSQRSRSSRSDDDERSYDSEESGSEEDSYVERDEEESRFTRDSGDQLPENMRHLDSMVEQGNWDGVMAAAAKFESSGYDDDEGSDPSKPSLAESEQSSASKSSADYDERGADTFSFDDRPQDVSGTDGVSYTSEEIRRREQYRGQVEALVKKVVPDEIDNVSAMLDQFEGREAELINTLQTMQDRSSHQRARKAVHKSKGVPQRDSVAFAAGGTDGSAAIAAASTLGVQAGFDDRGNAAFGDDQGEYYDDGDASYDEGDEDYDDDYQGGSQYSGSYSRSQEGSANAGGSYDSHSRSEEGYKDEEQGSYHSGSQSGSYYDDEQGSYYSDEGSRSRSGSGSYHSGSGSGSYRSGSRSGSGSYYDDEQGSYYSDERSCSQSGSGSYDDDQDYEYE